MNAQDVGCFLFLGEDPALSWFDASVACEQVPTWYYQALKVERREHFANSKVQEGGYLAEPMRINQMNFLSAFAGLEAAFVGIR